MPITDFLTKNAELYGDEICLTEVNPEYVSHHRVVWRELELVESFEGVHRRELTWREFNGRANRFANLLLSRGAKRGDKVAVLLMNCLEWLPAYFGALKAGVTVVPMNFRYSAEEIEYCLKLADVGVLVFGPEFIERVTAVKDNLSMIKDMFFLGTAEERPDYAMGFESQISKMPAEDPGVKLLDTEEAAIYFSSGTTGFPKAILHDHRSLVYACEVEQNHHGQSRSDKFLCIPPLYHTGAKMHWFGSLLSGSPAVLLRGVKPRQIIETAARERATIVWLLVPWAQDILDAVDSGEINLDDYDLSAWRLMHIGAQPVPPSLIRRWRRVFPEHAYDTNYGLSESIGPGAVHLGVENIHKVGAIGKAGYGWKTRILGEDGEPVARGDVGELAVFGDGVMKCYYKQPEETAAVLKDGWLKTGDMAREDEDGFIYLVDRKKDVIIMGGENIYPVQIEDFLRGHDKIKDVAVIGLVHERLGEIAAAIIETKPGVTCDEDEIYAFCASLPRYKRPRRVYFDAVPRNATGKIEKPRLREKYCGDNIVKRQTDNGNYKAAGR